MKKNRAVQGKIKERIHDRQNQEVHVFGQAVQKSDIFKFFGLISFFVISIAACFLVWPYIKGCFEPGGVDRVVADVQSAGPLGALVLFAFQVLQIIVAFIPGEVTQVAAGMMYGPWLGALLIAAGCVASSAFVYVLVRKLGAPFVQDLVPQRFVNFIDKLEETNRLNIIVFILFLIPGLPKDAFTYVVPLTKMSMRDFLGISTCGRLPGIIMSTYAASGLLNGKIEQSIIIFAIFGALAVLFLIFHQKVMDKLSATKARRVVGNLTASTTPLPKISAVKEEL